MWKISYLQSLAMLKRYRENSLRVDSPEMLRIRRAARDAFAGRAKLFGATRETFGSRAKLLGGVKLLGGAKLFRSAWNSTIHYFDPISFSEIIK